MLVVLSLKIMSEIRPKVTLSELILAAVCHLQERNGVRVGEIANFVAKKRGCKAEKIEYKIKSILHKAKEHGIFCEDKGKYRIQDYFDDSNLDNNNMRDSMDASGDSEEENEDTGVDFVSTRALSSYEWSVSGEDVDEENEKDEERKNRKYR